MVELGEFGEGDGGFEMDVEDDWGERGGFDEADLATSRWRGDGFVAKGGEDGGEAGVVGWFDENVRVEEDSFGDVVGVFEVDGESF